MVREITHLCVCMCVCMWGGVQVDMRAMNPNPVREARKGRRGGRVMWWIEEQIRRCNDEKKLFANHTTSRFRWAGRGRSAARSIKWMGYASAVVKMPRGGRITSREERVNAFPGKSSLPVFDNKLTSSLVELVLSVSTVADSASPVFSCASACNVQATAPTKMTQWELVDPVPITTRKRALTG